MFFGGIVNNKESFYSLSIRLVQQYKNSPFPKAFAFKLGSIAGIQHSLPLLEEVGVVQGSEHLPQVPAETIVYRVRCYTSWIQQMVKVIVPVEKNICNMNSCVQTKSEILLPFSSSPSPFSNYYANCVDLSFLYIYMYFIFFFF